MSEIKRLNHHHGLDQLRVLAAVMVIIQHVVAIYIFRTSDNQPFYELTAHAYMSISVYAVPLFVMLSGGLLLANPNNKAWQPFYQKTIRRIVIPTLIWSVLYVSYVVLKVIIARRSGQDVSLIEPFINWFNGRPYYHLWYLYMIIGLYLAVHWLIRIKEKVTEQQFLHLSLLMLIISTTISQTFDMFWTFWFIDYLGYFMLGYTIKHYLGTHYIKQSRLLIMIIVCSSAIFLIKASGVWSMTDVYHNLSLFNIIGSTAIYSYFVQQERPSLNVQSLAKHSFYIYLVHHGLIDVINIIQEKLVPGKQHPAWYVPVMTLVVLVLSYIIAKMLNYVVALKKRVWKWKLKKVLLFLRIMWKPTSTVV